MRGIIQSGHLKDASDEGERALGVLVVLHGLEDKGEEVLQGRGRVVGTQEELVEGAVVTIYQAVCLRVWLFLGDLNVTRGESLLMLGKVVEKF